MKLFLSKNVDWYLRITWSIWSIYALKENVYYDINYDYNNNDYITMITTMMLAIVLNEPKFHCRAQT